MTKFRFHRGSLADSMATVVEVDGRTALIDLLDDTIIRDLPPKAYAVTVKPYGGIDERIGWDTYIVLVDEIPVGFTDGPL